MSVFIVLLTIVLPLFGTTCAGSALSSAHLECRRDCTSSDASKYRFAAGQTYLYELENESLVRVSTINGHGAVLKWTANVELHFESPCEVTMEIKTSRIDGEANAAFEQQLTSHPLRAVMADGTFEEVCAHKDDVTSAVNIKKGILSQLQNTLPSNSTMFDGIEIPETDVLGVCPTVYKVRHESGKVLVEKTKDHRLCSKRFGSKSEHIVSAVPLKAPFPLIESKSICKQEIEEGIVKSVACVDQNELSPMPGVQRTAKAQLTSKLTLKSVSSTSSIKPLDKLRKTNLLYDYMDSPKNSSAYAKMESKLRELCATVEGKNVTKRTAELYSELIQSMDQVEERLISETLKNIKANKYCSNSAEKLAELYSDAVASTDNTGAIPMMVEEILKGSRQFQYTWRLHTIPRVCIHGVQAVKPIFENTRLPVPTILAAGSAVARYCATEGSRTKGGCLQQESVQQIMQTISAKIQQSCPSTKEDKTKRDSSVALLKAVANIKNATQELRSTILSCFHQSSAAMNVRVAAADTLRSIPCSREVTEKLLQDAKESSMDSELRIFAYKAAVKCANTSQLSSLIDEVTQTSDSQVRSFILSDLTNLQQSQAPYKVDVRQRLARFNISQEYSQNFTRNSRSFGFSKFRQSGSFGSEVDYELIFDGEGMLPRHIRYNLTVALFKQIINLGEIGVRAENLPGLLNQAVRAGTTFGKTSVGKMIRDLLRSQGGASSKPGQLELFVKVFGQEIFYSVLSDVDQAEHDVLMQLYNVAGEVYQEMSSHTQLQSFKGFQAKRDLVIPTIQGMPLHVTKELTAVACVNATPTLHGIETSLEYAPVLSSMTNLFVGYKFGPSAGLKINTTVFSSSDTIFRVQLDWPTTLNVKIEFPREEAELLKFENKGYMMVKLPGQKEQVKESSSRDHRKQGKQCSQALGGMQFCCDHDVLDIWQANDYPLVKKSQFKWTIKKESPSMKGIEFKFFKQENYQKYRTKLIIPGTQNPTKIDHEVSYQSEPNLQVLAIESKAGQGPQSIKIVHRREQRGDNELEVFVGGQQSQKKVFSGKLASTNEGQLIMKVKTEGGLKRFVLADVDVDVVLGRSSQSWEERRKSLQLNKFEVKLAAARCQAQSYIRKSPGSGGAPQILSQVQLSCNERQIIKTSISTTMQEQDQGLKLDGKVELEHGSQRCVGEVVLILNPSLKQLSVKASNEGSKMLQLIASDQKDSAQGRKSLVALELPKMDIVWKAASHFKGSFSDGDVDLSLLTQGREVLSIRGPISATQTESEKKLKSQLGIRFGQQGKTYHLTSEMEFTEQRNHIKAIVNEEQKLLFSYLHDLSGDGRSPMSPESQFSFDSKIELPEIVKTDVSLKKTSSNIQVDAEVKLEVMSPRHIQAHVAIDTRSAAEGHVSAKLLWDKARDPQKKIDISGTYRLQGNDHFSTQGEIRYRNEKFQYAVSSLLKLQKPWPNMEKDMQIEIMKGSEEVFTIKNLLHIETMRSGSLRVKSDAYLLTTFRNEYSWKKELDVIIGQSDYSVKMDSALRASTAGQARLSMFVSSKGGEVKAVAMQGNFEAIGVNQHEPALSARWEGDLEGNSEGGVEKVNLGVSVEADRQKIEIEASQNTADMETRLAIKKNGRSLVRGQVSRRQGNAVSAHFNLPSRSIEMTGRYDRRVKSLTIYPNKHQSNELISARLGDQSDENGKNLDLVVDYPHNGRQKKMIGSYRSQNQQTHGAVELDVFSEAGKDLKVKINGTRVSNDILQLEASIQSNSTEGGPTVRIDLSTASRDMYIIAAYKKDSQSAPSIFISTKYIKQAAHAGVLSVLIKTPESKVEMGGVVSSVNNYGCQGYKMNSTLQSGTSPKYDLEIVTCSPVFIKIVTGLKEGSERYVAKLGMESLLHAEISLMKDTQKPANRWWSQMTGSTKERREEPVVAISAKLRRPTTLTLRAQYNKQTLASTMDTVRLGAQELKENVVTCLHEIRRAVMTSSSGQDLPHLDDIIDYVYEVYNLVNMDLGVQTFPVFFTDTGMSISNFLVLIQNYVTSTFISLYEILNPILLGIIQMMNPWVEQISSWLELLENSLASSLSLAASKLHSTFVEPWLTWFTGDCDESSSASPASYLCRLYTDGRNVVRYLLTRSDQSDRPDLQRFIDLIASSNSSQLLQSIVIGVTKQVAGVYFGDSHVQVNLPLRQPVGSVLTAVQYIGFSGSQERDGNVTECKPNEIVFTPYFMNTINGQMIFLPAFHCEYKLAVAGGTLLSINNMGTEDAFLVLTYEMNILRVFLRNGHVYLGQNMIPNAISFNLGDFVVKKNTQTLLVETSDVHLMIYFLKEPFSIMSFKQNMTGIAGRSYPSSHPTIYELYRSFSRFRVDRTCIEYYHPHHCTNHALCRDPLENDELSQDHSPVAGHSLSLNSSRTSLLEKQLGYVILVDPYSMITAAQSQVELPSCTCEYELAQVNTTNVTIGYIGNHGAYIKFRVGKNSILVLISKNEIYVNDLHYLNDPAHVEFPDLHMQRSGPYVRVMSYQVHWQMEFISRASDDPHPYTRSRIFCYQWPIGIGGERYPDGSSSQYLLERFAMHKCNPICKETPLSSPSEINSRIFGRGVLGSVPFFTPDMISSAAARFIDRHSLSLVEVDQRRMITYDQTVIPWPTLWCKYTLAQIREEIVAIDYLALPEMKITFQNSFLSLEVGARFRDFEVRLNGQVITGNVSKTFGTTEVVYQVNSYASGLMIEGKSIFVYIVNDTATEGGPFAKVFAKTQPEGIGYIFYGDYFTPDILKQEFRRYVLSSEYDC